MGRGRIFPPWSIITQQSSLVTPNGLIFHDFVPSNIRKVLEGPFLEIILKISKILASTIFSELNPKGGPFYAKVKKSKKSNFFLFQILFFYLNMNHKCSKLSIEVSDMSYNQFLVILRTFLQGGRFFPPHVVTSFPEPMQNRVKEKVKNSSFSSQKCDFQIFLKNTQKFE